MPAHYSPNCAIIFSFCPAALRMFLILLLVFLPFASPIPIENGVAGDPEIECGSTSIVVNFNTQNNFEGHVYVKGLYFEEGCRTDGGQGATGGIELPFDTCNVARTRSLNPKGVFVSVTVIISFHPLFMTKVDRAYKLQCFYMEADKTVSTEIEVSMITTAFQTQVVPMPICRYEILEGGPTGPIIQYALIGDQIYHKWTCDTETVDTFCMTVYSCFVDDGNGDRVDLVDDEGCGLDRYLVGNLEYPSDLMGGVEAHVFKYADRPQLFFQCQIQIVVKEPNGECVRPDCDVPGGRGAGRRAKRYAETRPNSLDVRTQFSALDIDDQAVLSADQRYLLRVHTEQFRPENTICVASGTFAAVLCGLSVVLVAGLAGALTSVFMKRK